MNAKQRDKTNLCLCTYGVIFHQYILGFHLLNQLSLLPYYYYCLLASAQLMFVTSVLE